MSKRNFNKKPTSTQEQLKLLKNRGLVVDDEPRVSRYLNQISYYRLSAYFIPFQQIKNKFNSNVSFDNILNLYKFDRKLRLLIFDCIERIEVAIRAQITNVLCKNYNTSHWQDNKKIFVSTYKNKSGIQIDFFNDFQKIIRENCSVKNPEIFIKHYKNNYNMPENPPSWMCVELLTIGGLSRLYQNLKDNKDKQEISNYFGLHHTIFSSWLHTLTYIRNICAHHSRLWNREFAIKPEILKKPQFKWVNNQFSINQRVFYFLCILKYLLVAANPNNKLKDKIIDLFNKYPNIPLQFMGIPTDEKGNILNWQNEPLWK